MFNEDIKKILEPQYECKMISSGNNAPIIDIKKYNLMGICVLLHKGFSVNSIRDYFKWTEEELNEKINILLKEELVRIKNTQEISPTCMVISLEEGEKLFNLAEEFIDLAVTLIKNNIDEIKQKTLQLNCFKLFKFKDLSLFILSDILLDVVQINNVEKDFLKSDRTYRNGMNYYYSIQEKYKDTNIEAFGVYGNMSKKYGNIYYCLYGNKRFGVNFCTIDKHFIEKHFSYGNDIDISKAKEDLLIELVKSSKSNENEINKNLVMGFNELGIIDDNKLKIPIISKEEFIKFNGIANIIKDEYIDIFNKGRKKLFNNYQESIYSKEVSFEEYFIWWYHFFYTKVTDALIEKDIVSIPKISNFHYIVTENDLNK